MTTKDFRDTQYWARMNSQEQANYTYLMNKFSQAYDEFEFGVVGLTVIELHTIMMRAATDIMQYEVYLLRKYWRTNSPANDNGTVS